MATYSGSQFIDEWKNAYNDVYNKFIENGSIFDMLKNFLDGEKSNGNISAEKYMELYSNALVMAQGQINSLSAKTAFDLVVKKFNHDLDTEAKQEKINLDRANTAFRNEQKTALAQQVIDNRKIKAADTLGDTYAGFGARGITVSSDMWTTFFNIIGDLANVSNPSNTTVSEV